MEGFRISGKVICVVEELRREAERCKGMKVGEWLSLRKTEKAKAKQSSVLDSKKEG